MNVFLVPEAGRKVRKPNGEVLASDGETVEISTYWRRRLRDGDVKQTKTQRAKRKEN